MADVRSLLKSERAARRIQHKYASYTPAGILLCLACQLQLKSESLWEGHLRSAGHVMRAQKLQESQREQEAEAIPTADGNNKKRKASEGEDTIRKRSRPTNTLPEGFFDPKADSTPDLPTPPANEIRIPSRPATPAKPVEEIPKLAAVDEDEWAAFQADVAAADIAIPENAVISAPALSTADVAALSTQELNAKRKEREDAELEGDKEDAARKLEEEFEEMEGLEQRVRRLREKREALRTKESALTSSAVDTTSVVPRDEPDDKKQDDGNEGEDEDEDEDEDDWDGFRMKG